MEWIAAHWWQTITGIMTIAGWFGRHSIGRLIDAIADLTTEQYRRERCEALCRAKDLTIQDKTAENADLSETNARLRAVISRLRAGDDFSAGFSSDAANPSRPSTPSPMIPSSSEPSGTSEPVK